MKRQACLGAMVTILAGAVPTAQADLASSAAAIGAIVDPSLAPSGISGQIIGGYEGSGYQTTPLGAPDYDYTQPSPMGADAGELRDFHWIHENSGSGQTDGTAGTKWSFGNLFSYEFVLDPSIDHDPVPEEAIESTLWGSNDGGATWVLGTLDRLYAQGWDATSIEDEPSSHWTFSIPVNLVSATSGFSQGTYSYLSGDTEIDAVSMVNAVPLPGAVMLGAMGLGMVGLIRRRLS